MRERAALPGVAQLKALALALLAVALLVIVVGSQAFAAPQAPDVIAVDNNGDLIRFNSAAPETIISTTEVDLPANERLYDVDFRPVTRELYGDVYNGTTAETRIYKIDPATGAATLVTTNSVSTRPDFFGLDFDPVMDRLRLVSEADENFRINPDDGTVAPDTALAYATGDENEGKNPNVVGSAYTDNFPGATSTTLYGIDSTLNILVTQAPPNDGTLNTVGLLGVDTRDEVGFDVGSNGTAYASLTASNFISSFYTVNLTNGDVTLVGPIGVDNIRQPIQGIAVVPSFGSVEFSVVDYTVDEVAGTATITVVRTGGTNGAVSVDYATTDGTATAGSDYDTTTGTLNFASGDDSETFTVPITDDTTDESDETVDLELLNPTGGATLGTQSAATLTIIDNDGPEISIDDVTVEEGNTSVTNATFTVELSVASGQTVTVAYATANGTATAPSDYTATSGTLTFLPGDTEETLTVPVNGDTLDEADEDFFVNLSNTTNASISDNQGEGTITDNDETTPNPNPPAPDPVPDDCTIVGTEGDDVLEGTSEADVICGLGGNDTIKGKGGNDTILGGEGSDTLNGGKGKDTVFGGEGNDSLSGGTGGDTLMGGSRDPATGSSISSSASATKEASAKDTLDGGKGKDTCDAGTNGTEKRC